MCSPMYSSQIASDSVHSKWHEDDRARSARLSIPDWVKNEKVVFEEILAHPEYLRVINFAGGEPLIHPMFPKILEKLVDTGHVAHIEVYISSNGTRHSSHLSTLLTKFRSVELGFSVDGVGKLQEYIRPPSKWDTISRNVFAFQKENVPISIRPTIQAYNIFGLLDLARWCGTYRLRFVLDNVLYEPPYLSLDMLPQDVIDEALQDWVEYFDTECTEDNRWHVENVIAALRRPRPKTSDLAVLQDEFIRFTNDLDQSRGQSFATACPRLHDRLVAAGFDFHVKYRFSHPWIQLQEDISSLRDQLSQSQTEVKAMKSSKFWKIRSLWFSIKQKFGLGV
jgi:MoaA/NifB/PqqE/SkfB family radical SAM enzyme